MRNKKATPAQGLMLTALQKYMIFSVSPAITFVEAHKLAFFLQEFGAPLNLRFSAWRYGPYAVNMAHALSDMEGVYIKGFGDGTARAFDVFELLPDAYKTEGLLCKAHKEIIERTNAFIEGFESPTGLELLSSLYWLIKRENTCPDLHSVKEGLRRWCDNKDGCADRKIKLFTDSQINNALKRLRQVS